MAQLPDFSTLFDLLPIGAYRSSPEGRQLRANPALVRLNGYETEAELLTAVRDIAREWYVLPAQRVEFRRRLERDGEVRDFVSEIYRHRTRERIWIRETAHLVRDEQQRVLFYEGTVEDISEQRAAHLAVEASERRFRALIEKAQTLILLCSSEGVVSYASPAAQSLLGRSPDSLIGHPALEFIHPEDLAIARAEFDAVVEGRNSGAETSLRCAHADGGWRDLAALANNCLADSAVAGIVINLRDVTERKRFEDALKRQADRDALTDLVNRRFLIDRAGQALAYSLTRSKRLNALLYIDLDGFKQVNDSLGHDAGDRLLQVVAQRLRACVRSVDTVSRFGGDEFVVLLEAFESDAATTATQILAVAHKILAAVRQPLDLDGLPQSIGCSIGATLFGERREPVDAILKRADAMLYGAKRAGRDTVRVG